MAKYQTIQREPVEAVQWNAHGDHPDVEGYSDEELAADSSLAWQGTIDDIPVKQTDWIVTNAYGHVSVVENENFVAIWEPSTL